ncbi:DUF4266 domain-containing protein [Flavobacterium sp. CS20]|jgi:hypothetical protein|uniref:DUF4266 domain-containing protein n=1 Tax=Flavobacterium sp. CS20 TaxID=2775246 RepID=UPI001B39F344|nr:DUF4266 domain-containing protein [Flavobacterium sp. CS20]QTY28239.1 DUF4266 domain-containing protein [Flavobacterium sp. CS20]
MIKKISLISIVFLSLTSCVAVKEYEKVKINDPDMQLSQSDAAKMKSAFQSYREASAGANGGKTGGGCGCN